MNYPRLYRNHVLEWLDEANTWPDGTTKEFSFRSYGHISLALHEDNAPFRFELTLHHSFRTDGQMTWCFRNIESALLQIFNNFAVDPATPREYESLQQALDHALELAPVKTLVTFLTPTLDTLPPIQREFYFLLDRALSHEEQEIIRNSLEEGKYFIPEQLGLPAVSPVNYKSASFSCAVEIPLPKTRPQNKWCQLLKMEMLPSPQHGSAVSADAFVARCSELQKHISENGERPYLVTVQTTTSDDAVVWASNHLEATATIQELCDKGDYCPDPEHIVKCESSCIGYALDTDLTAENK